MSSDKDTTENRPLHELEPEPAASDSVDQSSEKENEVLIVEKREKWGRKADFLLSSLGYCVGFGNVWRFPYLAYKNGGASFLIPYFLMLIINGVPLFFMELAIGQWYSSGVIGVWKSVCPLMKGIGYAICVMGYLVGIYYIIILSWTFFLLFQSFRSEVPWKTCDNSWNTMFCREERKGDSFNCTVFDLPVNCTAKYTSPSAEFWTNNLLQITGEIGDFGDMRWELVGTTLLSWVVVYLCLFKGIKSSGKVVYFTATFPFIVLFILFIRGVTLDGAGEGVLFYLKPDFSRLADPQVWIYASTQIYWSLGVGFGTLITFGSYNKFENNCERDAMIISFANCGTSFFAGFVIFSVLGFMAYVLETTVSNVATSGPGLAFVVYPEAISQMPLSVLWAILFFFMLVTLGLDSQFATIEAVITALVDEYPWLKKGYRKQIFVMILCISMFLLGLPCVTQGGMYIFNLMDYQTAGLSLLFVTLMEIVAVGWIYGVDRFSDDIEAMTGQRPKLWFRICWKYLSPISTLVIILANVIQWKGVSYNNKPYPGWAEFLGWLMALSSMVLIPAFAIYQLWKTPGTVTERFYTLLKPDEKMLSQIEREHDVNRERKAEVILL
ncbi:sodium- and chloride-dependent GABA transporter 1-like isoform X1 [Porites lutea]|uniref:sodium- and chloride-dependent GABA transporter 1-like isoform X1 n=1 Tax=Porites lutea TaxID=51062 RepID=UPI003CC69699